MMTPMETPTQTLTHQSIPGPSTEMGVAGPSTVMRPTVPLQMPSLSMQLAQFGATKSPLVSPGTPGSAGSGSFGNFPAPGIVRRRRFSSAKIQPTRIKKVMQADEEIGRMVASVPVAIGKAMEYFAERFLKESEAVARSCGSRTLSASHMKQAMMRHRHFHFLEPLFKDIGPPRQMGEADLLRMQMQLSSGMDFSSSPMSSSPITPLTPSMTSPFSQTPITSLPPMPLLPGQPLPPHITSPLSPHLQHLSPHVQHLLPPAVQPLAGLAASQQPSVPSPVKVQPAPIHGKRNGSRELPNGEKPKRGRPRKIKKEEKCMDDQLCEDVTNGIEKEDKDREMMPPPALPGMGFGKAKV